MILQTIWFLLIGLLLTIYAILDGFDLGTGFWSFFVKDDRDMRILLNSVGPTWDGNEVWLLTGGGALFAAFPHVYATVFSGFYLAMMLVLFSLIFRAVSMEYRSKVDSSGWRGGWSLAFSLGSTLPALLFGVALGNVMRGVPMDSGHTFTGTFFTLLNPFALVIGLTGFAMFLVHGALWIWMKTGDDLSKRALSWAKASWIALILLFFVSTAMAFGMEAHLTKNFMSHPVLWIIPVLTLIFMILTRVCMSKGHEFRTFIWSALTIAGLMGIVGASLYPNMLPATQGTSLTIANASSSQLTLGWMLGMALIGTPLVLIYQGWAYKKFSGKVVFDEEGY